MLLLLLLLLSLSLLLSQVIDGHYKFAVFCLLRLLLKCSFFTLSLLWKANLSMKSGDKNAFAFSADVFTRRCKNICKIVFSPFSFKRKNERKYIFRCRSRPLSIDTTCFSPIFHSSDNFITELMPTIDRLVVQLKEVTYYWFSTDGEKISWIICGLKIQSFHPILNTKKLEYLGTYKFINP